MLRLIPTRVHGALDYFVGLLVALSPWVLGFVAYGPETWVPVALGLGAVAYSLVTNYEWGLYPGISMPTHLALDFGSGALLAASPWLFGFADSAWLPHVVLGAVELVVTLASDSVPRRAGVTER
jgi:hypothetical protein